MIFRAQLWDVVRLAREVANINRAPETSGSFISTFIWEKPQ